MPTADASRELPWVACGGSARADGIAASRCLLAVATGFDPWTLVGAALIAGRNPLADEPAIFVGVVEMMLGDQP